MFSLHLQQRFLALGQHKVDASTSESLRDTGEASVNFLRMLSSQRNDSIVVLLLLTQQLFLVLLALLRQSYRDNIRSFDSFEETVNISLDTNKRRHSEHFENSQNECFQNFGVKYKMEGQN